MKHSTCAEALHMVRTECASKLGAERKQCIRKANEAHHVHLEPHPSRTECRVAGDSDVQHVALEVSTTVPQTVYGMPLFGVPSRVVRE